MSLSHNGRESYENIFSFVGSPAESETNWNNHFSPWVHGCMQGRGQRRTGPAEIWLALSVPLSPSALICCMWCNSIKIYVYKNILTYCTLSFVTLSYMHKYVCVYTYTYVNMHTRIHVLHTCKATRWHSRVYLNDTISNMLSWEFQITCSNPLSVWSWRGGELSASSLHDSEMEKRWR